MLCVVLSFYSAFAVSLAFILFSGYKARKSIEFSGDRKFNGYFLLPAIFLPLIFIIFDGMANEYFALLIASVLWLGVNSISHEDLYSKLFRIIFRIILSAMLVIVFVGLTKDLNLFISSVELPLLVLILVGTYYLLNNSITAIRFNIVYSMINFLVFALCFSLQNELMLLSSSFILAGANLPLLKDNSLTRNNRVRKFVITVNSFMTGFLMMMFCRPIVFNTVDTEGINLSISILLLPISLLISSLIMSKFIKIRLEDPTSIYFETNYFYRFLLIIHIVVILINFANWNWVLIPTLINTIFAIFLITIISTKKYLLKNLEKSNKDFENDLPEYIRKKLDEKVSID